MKSIQQWRNEIELASKICAVFGTIAQHHIGKGTNDMLVFVIKVFNRNGMAAYRSTLNDLAETRQPFKIMAKAKYFAHEPLSFLSSHTVHVTYIMHYRHVHNKKQQGKFDVFSIKNSLPLELLSSQLYKFDARTHYIDTY